MRFWKASKPKMNVNENTVIKVKQNLAQNVFILETKKMLQDENQRCLTNVALQ